MNRLWLYLYRISRAKLRAGSGPHMVCCHCGLMVHRHDRFRVLEVVHINCLDTKLIGQMRIPDPQ